MNDDQIYCYKYQLILLYTMQKQEEEWEVEKILERGKFNKTVFYRVKWVGYPEEESTWEPIGNLDNCHSAILEFESSLKQSSKKGRKKKNTHINLQKIFGKELVQ